MDVPLNEAGRTEARVLADAVAHVPFVEAHSSVLSRAKEVSGTVRCAAPRRAGPRQPVVLPSFPPLTPQTAEIVLAKHANLELQTHPGLMERSLGSLEGQRWTRGHGVPSDAEASAE